MIVVRCPLRVSFFGGGSDLPAFCEREPGAVLGMAIRQYVYICLNKRFSDDVRLSYSRTEIVPDATKLEHDIAREALCYYDVRRGVEVVSVADVPGNTGLGSSSAYAAALCYALGLYTGHGCLPGAAETAAHVEIELCSRRIGRQDHYLCAMGGMRYLTFEGREVSVHTLQPCETLDRLEARLLMFHLGDVRDAAAILDDQQARVATDARDREATRKMVRIARDQCEAVERGDLSGFGAALDEAWAIKRGLARGMSTAHIDAAYAAARAAGAEGGKVCGAGGGGFLLLYAEPERHARVRAALASLHELPVRIAANGVKAVLQ